ncbi:MAG: peptidoglycan DD-metalloendopeptidase family protein [Candidatus Aminicenantes bacterium]|nr:peptidoglycan DD-metalloendopeptidase family protein [Candidatus Aminicenantes bacterium]
MISRPSLLTRQRIRRIIWLLLVIGLGVVLAWLFSPRPEPVAIAPVYRDLKLAEAREMNLRIGSGDFFAAVLERAGLTAPEAARLIADIRPAYDLASIRSGRTLTLFFEGGKLRNFIYPIDRDTFLEAEHDGQGKFSGRVMAVPYEIRREVARITIDNSLYESTAASGEKLELFEPLAQMFEYDVDFNRDIQPGDSLTAVLDKKYLNNRLAGYGDILAAELVNSGKAIRIVRYPSPAGHLGYYHPDGRSTKRQFLRCPLPFIRVTSRFGMRLHPVLGFSARHSGTDFAAPYGTPVRATASGVVIARGRDDGRGNYVAIRHANGYASYYYHLQRFAAGLSAGQRLEQGRVIGFVGNSGLSTGPHLHYGLRKNGAFLNPLRLQSPSVAPLPESAMEDFRKYCAEVCRSLQPMPEPAASGAIAVKPGHLPAAAAAGMDRAVGRDGGREG